MHGNIHASHETGMHDLMHRKCVTFMHGAIEYPHESPMCKFYSTWYFFKIRWCCLCLQFPLSADRSPMFLLREIDSRYQAWIQNVKFSSIVWRNERYNIQIKIRCVKKAYSFPLTFIILVTPSYVVAARLPLSSTPQDENMCNSGKLILFFCWNIRLRSEVQKWNEVVCSSKINLPNQIHSHPLIVALGRGMLYFLTLLSKERFWNLPRQFSFVW